MPSKREFFRTVLKVEVLSVEPFRPKDLAEADAAILAGAVCGRVLPPEIVKISGKSCALALMDMEQDPSVFRLSEEGHDIDED